MTRYGAPSEPRSKPGARPSSRLRAARPGDPLVADYHAFATIGQRSLAALRRLPGDRRRGSWRELAALAPGYARRRAKGNRQGDREQPPSLRVRPLLPVARRPPARPGGETRARARPRDRILSRPRGRRGAGRIGIVGAPQNPRPRRHHRRAARSVLHPGTELEPAGAESARRRARGLGLAQRALPRQHAPRRDAADRSRDGA